MRRLLFFRPKPTVISLIILNLSAFLMLLVVLLWQFDKLSYLVEADIADLPPAPNQFQLESLQKTSLNDFLERPIFHISRRRIAAAPLKVEDAPVIVDHSTELEGVRLIGIVLSGASEGWAYLYSSHDNQRITLKKGEDFNGWRLSEVSQDKITLRNKNRVAVMEQKNGGNPQYGAL